MHAVVECKDEVHCGWAAEREKVTRQKRAFSERRKWLIDRVAPLVRTELGTGNLEYSVALGERVERRRSIEPRSGWLLVAFECWIDETTVAQCRQVDDGEEANDRGDRDR